MATMMAGLRGWIEPAYLNQSFAVPLCLVLQHGNECTPASIRNRLGKMTVSYHSLDIQILAAHHIVSANEVNGNLMQLVLASRHDFLLQPGNLDTLPVPRTASLLLT